MFEGGGGAAAAADVAGCLREVVRVALVFAVTAVMVEEEEGFARFLGFGSSRPPGEW